jgi:MFS family permease
VRETRDMSRSPSASGILPLSFAAQIRTLTRDVGFVLVSLISLMNAVVRTGGLFAIIPILATTRLGLSVTAIGFAMMLGSVSGLFASYPAGWLADRYGRKTVIVPVTLVSGFSMVLFCFAPSYPWFVAACLVWGVAIAAGSAAPAAYAADSAPPGMNAAAMSTFRMTGDIGYVVGPLALGFITDLYGPVTALLAGAAGLVFAGAMFGLIATESHTRRRA